MEYKIKTLDFKYENLESACDLLKDLEEGKHTITCLDLSHNTYYPVVFAQIVKRITHFTHLIEINLDSTLSCLNLDEMVEICKLISLFVPKTLKKISMSANALSCNIPNEWCDFIAECNDLEELTLHNCGLGHDGISKIFGALKGKCIKLKVLDIGKNRINILNKELGKIVNGFNHLLVFKMAHNTVSEGLNDFLGEINHSLDVLDITDNFVDELDGLKNILSKNTLKEIYLRDIKTENMSDVLKIFLTNNFENLKILDISQNDMETEECLIFLMEIVKRNKSLKKLVIYDNFYETEYETMFLDLKILMNLQGKFVDEDPSFIEEILIEKLSRI
ncbi:hypothetical protein EHP00_756 [Ecytonucleospora hepatopenaei]|uniref:Uncharacterized protein n=1 Tax=Ecytonucleospora hepatopenaei TaxID=646526 RepID=A0A1W0E3C7_9MICR|nr:hypothetical protein EHP00_756 [Ecytonucleospora hepatopenaei]